MMALSGSGSYDLMIVGGENQNGTPPFQLFFPCRERLISTNTTSPFVWGIHPALQNARIYAATIEAIFLVGVIWNLFVLVCYCMKPSLLKEPANIYLFNLAVIDLLLSVLITFSSFLTEVIVFGSSDFVLLVLGSCADHLCPTVPPYPRCSLRGQVCISLQTFKVQVHIHLEEGSSDTGWFMGAVYWNSHHSHIWFRAIRVQPACITRMRDTNYQGKDNINYVIFVCIESQIPILILTFTNIWTIMIVRSFLKKKLVQHGSNNDKLHQEENQYQQQQRQLIRIFGTLFITHIVCWIPVCTASFVSVGIGATKLPEGIALFGWLSYISDHSCDPTHTGVLF